MAGEERLRSLKRLVENAQTALHRLGKDERRQHAEAFSRLEATLAYLALVLERTDPLLVADAAHAELTRLLEDVSGNPAAAAANPASYADALMSQSALLPAAQSRDLEQAGRDAAKSLRRSASQHINALAGEATQLRQRLDEIAQAAEEAEASASAANKEASAELKTELESIQTAAATAQHQVEELAETLQETFEKEQADRATEANERWTGIREEIEKQAENLVADLSRMRNDAQGLVGAVSVATTANHFRDDAAGERKAYWLLLGLTVLALGAAVYFAGTAAAHSNLEVPRVIAKLGVSSALVALGLFTGSRARDHREREKRSRDKELDMRVFGPFIEPLPPKEQIRERILMARRFFGRAEPDAPEQTDEEIELLSSPDEIDIAARDLRDGSIAARSNAEDSRQPQ